MSTKHKLRIRKSPVMPFPVVTPKELGRRLLSHRQRLGLTQPQVAEQLNLVPYYISTLEHGRVAEPGAYKLLAIAAFYKTTVNRLLKP